MSTAPGQVEDDRLAQVFELELARGCDNQVVMGGIDRLLVGLAESGALGEATDLGRRARALPVGGYRSLTPGQREAWLRGTLAVLAAGRRRGERTSSEAPRAPARPAPLVLESPVTRLPGVGRSAAERFARLGVHTAGDAAQYYPRRYSDYSDVRSIAALGPTANPVTVVGRLLKAEATGFGRRMRGTEALVDDGTGVLRVTWYNMPYVARALSNVETIALSGRLRVYRGRLQMENPDWEPFDDDLVHTGRLVPVYPATAGLGQRTIRRAVKAAVDALADRCPDPIPAAVSPAGRPAMAAAIRTIHYPPTFADAEAARQRLALGEFLAVQCAVLQRRAEWQQSSNAPRLSLGRAEPGIRAAVPFALTGDQERTLAEILGDLRGPVPMLRLLQGDVGSGKTVVAFFALLAAVASGHQGALMAPTEILAEQHYRSFARLLGQGDGSALEGVFAPKWLSRPIRMLLLTGSLTASQRDQVRSDAANGGADLIVGTHALLESEVALPRLGLAVVDEQHRFGVVQRLKLRQKGANPHLLVMTATPIPRTLALTVYGDLESSVIRELPPGRTPVSTAWVQPHERDEAYAVIRERLEAGEQAFVICPLVEGSETLDVRSAEEEYERLRRGPLRGYAVDLLHGRMTGRQKDDVMTRFAGGEVQVLVSTSVVEVGIDVPNATVMVIEGAERFGLSQLHQFRGRVGRSDKPSYCLLFSSSDDPGPDAVRRIEAMVATQSGFDLAEVDLELRGEGEAWGTAQSGLNTMLRVARLTDRDLLLEARGLALRVRERDPGLQLAEHRALAAAVKPYLERATEAN